MKDSIAEAVKREVATYAGVTAEEISLDDRFEDLGVDSLDAIGLISDLEDEYDVEVDDEALRDIRTVADAIRVIEQAVGSSAQAGDA